MRLRHAILLLVTVLAAAEADTVHADIHQRFAAAVVGIGCKGPAENSGFFGTGVVITAEGLILTSTTVVPEGGREIRVTFTDGRILAAQLVRTHASSEGSLLRLETAQQGLVHMPLADAEQCRVGDPVYSWGNPYGTIQRDGAVSLSVGRISGIAQASSIDDQSRYRGLAIETDAAVNPGSDGGPLTDTAGRLLGLQSLAYSERRWLGLAVPVTALRACMPELQALPLAAPAGSAGPGWERERQVQARAKAAEASVVGIWVEREGDSLKPPASRSAEQAAERPGLSQQQRAQAESRIPEGCSSGFIIAANGLVATAAINVANRITIGQGRAKKNDKTGRVRRIWVYAADGSRHPAKVAGKDDTLDVAILTIDAKDKSFPALEAKAIPAGKLAVGATVLVLGRSEPPGGVTINAGHLSAVERHRGELLQISALINHGNLGGPVLDLQGRLLGMANKLGPGSPWRQNCGVGFCIQAERLAAALPLLAAGKPVPREPRAMLGAQLDADALGTGAVVTAVVEDGPAAQAGVLAGDAIIAVDADVVDDFITFANVMSERKPGDRVKLKVRRGGATVEISLVLGADTDAWNKDEEEAATPTPAPPERKPKPLPKPPRKPKEK